MDYMSNIDNLLKNKYPDLLAEWDYARNEHDGIDVNTVTCGSNIKVWWYCRTCNGHYKMKINSKTSGQGCPYCTGRKVLKGFNDLQSCYPELVESSWDWVENDKIGLKPDEITSHAEIESSWYCHVCKGSYKMMVYNKVRGQSCPYCTGKRVLAGFNDLASKYQELIDSEWDWIENDKNGLKPDEITPHSKIKANWHCNTCSGRYKSKISDKVNGTGCPYCIGRKVLKGYNDLESQYPDLMNEWDWVENDKIGLKPDEITSGSNIKAWWHCNTCDGHYQMRINNRTNGIGCPYCAGKKVLNGFNDLQSKYPDLMKEWDWVENDKIGLKPDEITYGSDRKVWWRCSHNRLHLWYATVFSRTRKNNGCPKCSNHISKQENQVADYINDYLCSHYVSMHYTMHRSITFKSIYENMSINAENVNSDLLQHLRRELDIYIPELSLAVEYDGDYWHEDSRMLSRCGLTNDEAHEIKQELCSQAGIDLIFISEHDWVNDTVNVRKRIIDIIDSQIEKLSNSKVMRHD